MSTISLRIPESVQGIAGHCDGGAVHMRKTWQKMKAFR